MRKPARFFREFDLITMFNKRGHRLLDLCPCQSLAETKMLAHAESEGPDPGIARDVEAIRIVPS